LGDRFDKIVAIYLDYVFRFYVDAVCPASVKIIDIVIALSEPHNIRFSPIINCVFVAAFAAIG